jgi:hypothetical protein
MAQTAEAEPVRVVAPAPAPPPQAPLPLDYAARLPPGRLRRMWQRVLDLGPIVPRPSILTLTLLVACAAASYWLAHRPEPWRLVRTFGVAPSNGTVFPNVHYLPGADAIASGNTSGSLALWRPWTGEDLRATEPSPAALPPNLPPGLRGQAWWVTASSDESKLLAKSELGDFVWDARSGRLLAELSASYLGADGAKRPYCSLGGLSPDGSRLCIVNDKEELLLYDISGPAAALLARRQLQRPAMWWGRVNQNPTFHIRYSPDGRHVLVLGDNMIWLGDAATLEQRQFWQPPYCRPSDVTFLRRGERMLTLFHGHGDAQEVRLYDLKSGQVLRRWPVPDDPTMLAVSPDEKRAFVGMSSQAGMVLELDGTGGGFTRRAPTAEWPEQSPTFFPDNRRMAISQVWQGCPGIIDLATGRHVANLHPVTAEAVFARTIVSPDGRYVALFTPRTRLDVYEQVGRESAWGVFATWRFWALALCVALLVASLCRDALRSRRRWGRMAPLSRLRKALAALLVTAGGAALICPFVWFALERRVLWDPQVWWEFDGWIVALFLFYLLAGLGLLTGSRLWMALLAAALAGSVALALWLASTSGQFAQRPERIFDRMWMLPPRWMAAAQVSWAALALAGLVALLVARRPAPAKVLESRA